MTKDDRVFCSVCAWRGTCAKKFSKPQDVSIHCVDFSRDVTIGKEHVEPNRKEEQHLKDEIPLKDIHPKKETFHHKEMPHRRDIHEKGAKVSRKHDTSHTKKEHGKKK